ncbi:beta-phosphoglucomutase [Gaoshiqia sp. Z1-71]|uniref:beta-phosphoglucomutase n=1 Tax=Gaoshiqia hydrogeniformans TaxID=3290090 RepID=UPI003BF8884E
MKNIKACLFDLDGVIVDTAKYHFLAWKQLAEDLKIDFTEAHNELLKGVSRMRSLDIILELGKKTLNEEQKIAYADKKNNIYLSWILKMEKNEILPGVRSFISELKNNHILVALGSASKNTGLILQKLEIEDLFDAVVDGNQVTKAKPDPEVFLKGAEALKVSPDACVVFEDAIAGIEAAKNAGMFCVGVGDKNTLKAADLVIPGFEHFRLENLIGSM